MTQRSGKPYLSSNAGRVRIKPNISTSPSSEPPKQVPAEALLKEDIYGGGYSKARSIAFARSGGRCQFCGLRRAEEAHHWAYNKYPTGNDVQHQHLTALCKSCHIFATILRDWVMRKEASLEVLTASLDGTSSFYEKREVFSYWLFPLNDQKSSRTLHSQIAARTEPTNPQARTFKAKHHKYKGRPSNLLSRILWFILGLTFLIRAIASKLGQNIEMQPNTLPGRGKTQGNVRKMARRRRI